MLTFDIFYLSCAETSKGTLVLGSGDTGGAHGAMYVDDGSAHRGAALPQRDPLCRLGSHDDGS